MSKYDKEGKGYLDYTDLKIAIRTFLNSDNIDHEEGSGVSDLKSSS